MTKRNSKYGASKPKHEWGNGWMKNGLTESQVNYLNKLAAEKGVKINFEKIVNRGVASFLIDELKYRFSTTGLFERDFINTGIVEVL